MNGNQNNCNKELTFIYKHDIVNKQGELEMSNENKVKAVSKVVEPIEPAISELTCQAFTFFRNPLNGVFYTVKIKFDPALTTAEFSDKEIAGDDKQVAVERLKILLATKLFP